jgi:uncharacterized protein YceK
MRGIVLFVMVALLAGCSAFPKSCQAQAKDYRVKIAPLVTKFSDTLKLADSTPRMSLPPIISNLQTIRRDLLAVPAPECVKTSTTLLADGSDMVVNGYMHFMANQDTNSVSRDLNTGMSKLMDGISQVVAVAEGAKETPTPAWALK